MADPDLRSGDLGVVRSLSVVCLLWVLHAQIDLSVHETELTLSEGTSMAAAVSPDRRWVAIDLLGSLWVLPIRGGEAKQITPPLFEARQPTWSPDSDEIAFQGYGDDGTWHIYVVPREGGEPRALTSGEFDDREPAWSHHSRRIAFSSDRFGGIITIWEVDASTGQVTQLSKRDGWMPSWSPNDREITIISGDRFRRDGETVPDRDRRPGLWALTRENERLLVANTPGVVPVAAGWSEDSSHLAFVTAAGTLIADSVPREANAARQEDVFPFRPSWISDTEFVYTADGRIWRSSLGRTVEIPFNAKISLRRANYQITHRDIEASGVQTVRGIVSPAVSPDGHAIAFIALGDLWVMLDGEQPVRVTNDAAVELDPAWSPDGRQLAFSSDRTGQMSLWLHSFSTNRDTQLPTVRGAISGAAWSPDGSHIAYLVDGHGFAATRVGPGNGLGSAVVTRGGEIGRPTWAPDSRAIAFGSLFRYSDRYREGLNQLLVHAFDSTAETPSVLLPRRSAGNRQSGGPVWSRNGSKMAFVSEGRLWVADVDTRAVPVGQPFAITPDDDHPEFPSWQGDSRHVLYQTPAGLRRVEVSGGTPEPVNVDLRWVPAPPPARVVVHAGAVFDGVIDSARGEADIIVENGVIREIAAHSDELHTGAVVDARDEFVMPGLVEMHAHLDPTYGVNFGRVWLAYGITSVRMPAVNPYEAIEARESFDAGRRVGPRLFSAGDPFDGRRIYYPGGVAIGSDEQLDGELDRARALDIDFFKTYVRLPDRMQKRIVDFAHSLGKPVTSHELYPAAAFGVDGVEHLRGTSRRGYSTKASSNNRAYRDVIDIIARSGMTLTPTIGIQGGFEARVTGDKSLLFDPRLALYPLSVVSRLTDLSAAPPNAALDARIKPYEDTLKAVVAAGGRVIAGTDAPIDPYGLGLHVELESYVHAGLTAFQALQSATINAARALGLEDQLGTIEPGKIADLTFLGSNPLDDIRNTRDVKRVMKGGRLYTAAELVKR